MLNSFPPNVVRPNTPLRKPSSNPVSPWNPSLLSQPMSEVTPVVNVNSPSNVPVNRDTPVVSGSTSQLNFCNYCGRQGTFRCKRCKKTPYCSLVCQTEDWKAHRHVCKACDPEPVKEKLDDKVSSVMGDSVSIKESQGDTAGLQRVYLRDLRMTEVVRGTDMQAHVVEFYSPGRFFLLVQSPDLLKALGCISTELQKMHGGPSVTTYIPCVGEVCAIQFSSDLNWYRGLIKTLATDQMMANILYIDFGNEEDVPMKRIKPLPATIQPFCPCAMECRITGVVPVGGNWSEKCCNAVKQLLIHKTATVRVVEEYGRVKAVDILLSTGKQLSTFLVENGYAAEETKVTPTAQEIQAMVSVSLENFRRLSDGKDDNTWAQPPEPLTQAVGDSFAVVVTHLLSPSEIIVQKVENAGRIQELQLKLREHCSRVTAPQNFRPAPGTVCCAQFSEDKQWYRAKVLAYSSEERVCVGYLDFGNSEEVDIGHLRSISPSLLSLPMQAMPCALAGVQPVGDSWSKECVSALQRRVSNRILHVEIQGELEGKVLVAMIDEASDPQADVAELLSAAGFAAPALDPSSSNKQADQNAAAGETLHVVSTSASEPLVWSSSKLPSHGQTVSVIISRVMNPHGFYCYIDNPTDRQRLRELEEELEQHFKVNTSAFEPKVGEPCCATLRDTEQFVRVMVNGISEDRVSVNCVDHGFTMQVEKSLLRHITPRLLALPFQAILCSLAGVEPPGSDWSSEALLWFSALVDQKFSACVISGSEQGYSVNLEGGTGDVAAALIANQLAKAPAVIPKETHETTDSEVKYQDPQNENKLPPNQLQTSNHAGAGSEDIPNESLESLSEGPSFPVDWTTEELPLNVTFEPFIATVISPTLFYLLGSSQVNQGMLQGVMTELTAYCSQTSLNSLTSAALSRPAPGAACCAQFSDNKWYRAVVLEVGEDEVSVIYADYGNHEKVPFSRILPIPKHLLQLPFQIIRCTLTGKEHFPSEWPEEVMQVFRDLLLIGSFATVESFDGSANVLSLALHAENGGGRVTAMILDALQAHGKRNACSSATQKPEQTDGSTQAARAAVVLECPQTKMIPQTQTGLENTAATKASTPEPSPFMPQQEKSTSSMLLNEDPVQKIVAQMEELCPSETNTNDPPTSSCCCQKLSEKIENLEQLVQLQLCLMEQLVGQKN